MDAKAHLEWRLDRRDADLAVALRAVPVADGQQRPRHLDRQAEPRAHHDVTTVDVPPEAPRRHDRRRLVHRWTDANRPRERSERQLGHVEELRHLPCAEVPDVQARLGKVLRQQSESGQDGRPPPAEGLGGEQLDLDGITHLGPVHGKGSPERIDAIPVEVSEVRRRRLRGHLVVRDLCQPAVDDRAVLDDRNGFQGRIPAEVDRCLVELEHGRCSHRSARVTSAGCAGATTGSARRAASALRDPHVHEHAGPRAVVPLNRPRRTRPSCGRLGWSRREPLPSLPADGFPAPCGLSRR
jgi:hypothetical protein